VIIFTHWVTQTFPLGWGVSQLFGTFSLVEVQGFCRILPDFLVCEQLSIPLNLLASKGFRFSQQALLKPSNCTKAPISPPYVERELIKLNFSGCGRPASLPCLFLSWFKGSHFTLFFPSQSWDLTNPIFNDKTCYSTCVILKILPSSVSIRQETKPWSKDTEFSGMHLIKWKFILKNLSLLGHQPC
jgi:hypothetical protein